MTKNLLLAVCMVFSVHTAFAQKSVNEYLSLDTVINIPSPLLTSTTTGIHCCKNGDCVYFTNYDTHMKTDSVILYQLDTRSMHLDSTCIVIPGLRNEFKKKLSTTFDGIACNGKTLILYNKDYYHHFEKSGNTYVLAKRQDGNYMTGQCKLLYDSLLLVWKVYYGHTPQTCIQLLNFRTGKITREISPYFFHPLLCYITPHSLIDACNNKILFAQKGKYAISLFNNKLDSVNAITRDIKDWKSLSDKQIKYIKKHYDIHDAGDICDKVGSWHEFLNLQRGIYWIDSSSFLTIWQSARSKNDRIPNIYVDVWKEQDGKYVLKDSNIADNIRITPDENGFIHRKSYGLGVLSGHKYVFFKDKIVVFRNFGSDINPLGMKLSDYGKQHDAYFAEHGANLQIFVFSHHFLNSDE